MLVTSENFSDPMSNLAPYEGYTLNRGASEAAGRARLRQSAAVNRATARARVMIEAPPLERETGRNYSMRVSGLHVRARSSSAAATRHTAAPAWDQDDCRRGSRQASSSSAREIDRTLLS